MTTGEDFVREQTPAVSPGNYSPVTVYMKDTLGVIFLGIFASLFLIKWLRTETRYRALLEQRETTNGNDAPDTR